MSDEETKGPSLFSMMGSFTKEVATYIKEGKPNVTEVDYNGRLAACNACPHLKRKKMRCGLCGCLIQHKAKWKTTSCPDKPERWTKQEVDGKG